MTTTSSVSSVKESHPKLLNTAHEAGQRIDLEHPEFEAGTRGHGRIDRRRAWTALVPSSTDFPDARTYLVVKRESSTLGDVRTSIETRFYVTDLTTDDTSVEHLLRLTRGHWSIESLHRVRHVMFDEDRSQVVAGTPSRILAIGIIGHAICRTVNIAAATRQLARRPELTLDLLGIPR